LHMHARLFDSIPFGAQLRGVIERAYALFADGSDSSLVRRLAGAAFLIRVVSAALTFVSQILLARWMGGFEFGIYIYGWTWVLLIGGMVDLGLGSAAQRFIPEYTEQKRFTLLRGFLSGSRWLALLFGTIAGAVGALAVKLLTPHIDPSRPSYRSICRAHRCRCLAFGRRKARSRARTIGSISGCRRSTCSGRFCCWR
jgi:hypothetical protein